MFYKKGAFVGKKEFCIYIYIFDILRLYRGINDFKKGYQPRTTIARDEKGDLVADSHSIMMR